MIDNNIKDIQSNLDLLIKLTETHQIKLMRLLVGLQVIKEMIEKDMPNDSGNEILVALIDSISELTLIIEEM